VCQTFGWRWTWNFDLAHHLHLRLLRKSESFFHLASQLRIQFGTRAAFQQLKCPKRVYCCTWLIGASDLDVSREYGPTKVHVPSAFSLSPRVVRGTWPVDQATRTQTACRGIRPWECQACGRIREQWMFALCSIWASTLRNRFLRSLSPKGRRQLRARLATSWLKHELPSEYQPSLGRAKVWARTEEPESCLVSVG